MFFIHNIYTSTTRQEPVKNPKESGARNFLHFPQNQTLPSSPTTTTLWLWMWLWSPLLFLLHPPKAFLRFLLLFPGKFIASKIHLSAGDTVHHPRMTVVHVRITPSPAVGAHRFYKLCVWFRPLVEVHVWGSNWHACVTCVVDTLWYANRAHLLSGVWRIALGLGYKL